jgi:hypothetical protein
MLRDRKWASSPTSRFSTLEPRSLQYGQGAFAILSGVYQRNGFHSRHRQRPIENICHLNKGSISNVCEPRRPGRLSISGPRLQKKYKQTVSGQAITGASLATVGRLSLNGSFRSGARDRLREKCCRSALQSYYSLALLIAQAGAHGYRLTRIKLSASCSGLLLSTTRRSQFRIRVQVTRARVSTCSVQSLAGGVPHPLF